MKVNADQICDAIRIYSSDNDETWPGQPNDLNPYLHGQTIDPGFRITSPGVKLRGVTDTSTWECAVVEGSVWKVLVYADFHTKLVEK